MTDIDNTNLDSDNEHTSKQPLGNGMQPLSEADKSFLQKEIERARAESDAVIAEFRAKSEADPINGLVDAAKDRVLEALPDALENIINTVKMGSTESIRFQASKYIADLALGAKKSGGTDPKDTKFKAFLDGILGEDVTEDDLKKSTELKTNEAKETKGSDG